MKKISCREAIREALAEEMLRDDNVVLIGEDLGCYGGCFKLQLAFLKHLVPSK